MKLASLMGLALVGCATATPEQFVMNLPTTHLCYFAVGGNPQQVPVARNELSRRNVSCSPQMTEMGAREVAELRAQKAANQAAGNAAMIGAGAALLAPPQPQGLNCTTEYVGYQAFTRCR